MKNQSGILPLIIGLIIGVIIGIIAIKLLATDRGLQGLIPESAINFGFATDEEKMTRDVYEQYLRDNFKNNTFNGDILDSTYGEFIGKAECVARQAWFRDWRRDIYQVDDTQISSSYFIGKRKIRQLIKFISDYNYGIKEEELKIQGIYINMAMNSVLHRGEEITYLDPIITPVLGNGGMVFELSADIKSKKPNINILEEAGSSVDRSSPCPDICP